MITFRQLEIFLTVSEHLHFAKSAETLGITTAALSCDVKKLEGEVGCRLIDRSDRWRIQLTEAGKVFLEQIRPLPEILRQAKNHACRTARGEIGELSIAVTQSFCAAYDVSVLLRKMNHACPEITLRITETAKWPETRELLLRREMDVGFMFILAQDEQLNELEYRNLFATRLMAVFPEKHPLAVKKHLGLEDWRRVPFILPPENSGNMLRKLFVGKFTAFCGQPPRMVQAAATGIHVSFQMAASGLGVAVIPEDMQATASEFVRFRELPFILERTAVAAWCGENPSPALKKFRQLF